MSVNINKALALTAATGLLAGLAACGAENKVAKDASDAAGDAAADTKKAAANCCKGKNDCKGKGNCKTDANDCAGKNECKGKGGCKPDTPECQ